MAGRCRVCGEDFDRRRYDEEGRVVGVNRDTRTCPRHRWLRRPGGALIDKDTPYEEDVACQLFVATFRGGATLDAIAMALGVSRERVRQIQNEAVKKLRAAGVLSFGLEAGEMRGGARRHDGPDEEQDEEEVSGELELADGADLRELDEDGYW